MTYEQELEFTEIHAEKLLSYIGICWDKTNGHLVQRMMDWAMPYGWEFHEALLSYYHTYPQLCEYFLQLVKRYN